MRFPRRARPTAPPRAAAELRLPRSPRPGWRGRRGRARGGRCPTLGLPGLSLCERGHAAPGPTRRAAPDRALLTALRGRAGLTRGGRSDLGTAPRIFLLCSVPEPDLGIRSCHESSLCCYISPRRRAGRPRGRRWVGRPFPGAGTALAAGNAGAAGEGPAALRLHANVALGRARLSPLLGRCGCSGPRRLLHNPEHPGCILPRQDLRLRVRGESQRRTGSRLLGQGGAEAEPALPRRWRSTRLPALLCPCPGCAELQPWQPTRCPCAR